MREWRAQSGAAGIWTPETIKPGLAKQVGEVLSGPEHSPVSAAVEAIRASGLAAGMSNLDVEPIPMICMPSDETVRGVLERILASVPSLRYDAPGGVVNLLDSRVTDLLETRLVAIEIPHPKADFGEALELVFQAPEMRKRCESLGVTWDRQPRVRGVAREIASRAAATGNDWEPGLRFRDVTVRV